MTMQKLWLCVLTLVTALVSASAIGAPSCDFLFRPDVVSKRSTAFYRPTAPSGQEVARQDVVEIYPTRVKVGNEEFDILGVRKVISIAQSNLLILIGDQTTVLQRNPWYGNWQNATVITNMTADVGLVWFLDLPFQVTTEIQSFNRVFRITDKGVVDIGMFDYESPYQNAIVRNWRGQSPITGVAVNFQGDTVTVHTQLDGSHRFKLQRPMTPADRAYISSGMGSAQ